MNFAHLRRLTTAKGVFEHCLGDTPRLEHGYCTDDVARALVAVAREPVDGPELRRMASVYLHYLAEAYRGDGRFADRRDVAGRWSDDVFDPIGADAGADASGRAVWALGTAAALLTDPSQRAMAHHLFDEACRFRSVWPRATAFAVLGAGAMAAADPSHVGAARLLADAAVDAPRPSGDPRWPWPEPRLTYANAVLAEMLLVLGRELGLRSFVYEGLHLLEWLVLTETTTGGWLSVTPSGGWGRGEPRPGFDQQPIEAAALADACMRAWSLTGDDHWLAVVRRCIGWFTGHNDRGVPLVDLRTGAGFDGLMATGRNDNRGAESTLAALTTLQWQAAVA